jgi:hypothetical protein
LTLAAAAGPKYFLKDYNQVLLADAYGGMTAWWPTGAAGRFAAGDLLLVCARVYPNPE